MQTEDSCPNSRGWGRRITVSSKTIFPLICPIWLLNVFLVKIISQIKWKYYVQKVALKESSEIEKSRKYSKHSMLEKN